MLAARRAVLFRFWGWQPTNDPPPSPPPECVCLLYVRRESRHALGKTEWKRRGVEGRKKKREGERKEMEEERRVPVLPIYGEHKKRSGRKGRKDEGWERTRGGRGRNEHADLLWVELAHRSGFGHWISRALQSGSQPPHGPSFTREGEAERERGGGGDASEKGEREREKNPFRKTTAIGCRWPPSRHLGVSFRCHHFFLSLFLPPLLLFLRPLPLFLTKCFDVRQSEINVQAILKLPNCSKLRSIHELENVIEWTFFRAFLF